MVVIEEIHKKIAKELEIKESIVEEINRIQFQFLAEEIKKGESNISLIHIGKWIRRPYKTWMHNGRKYEVRNSLDHPRFKKQEENEDNPELKN